MGPQVSGAFARTVIVALILALILPVALAFRCLLSLGIRDVLAEVPLLPFFLFMFL